MPQNGNAVNSRHYFDMLLCSLGRGFCGAQYLLDMPMVGNKRNITSRARNAFAAMTIGAAALTASNTNEVYAAIITGNGNVVSPFPAELAGSDITLGSSATYKVDFNALAPNEHVNDELYVSTAAIQDINIKIGDVDFTLNGDGLVILNDIGGQDIVTFSAEIDDLRSMIGDVNNLPFGQTYLRLVGPASALSEPTIAEFMSHIDSFNSNSAHVHFFLPNDNAADVMIHFDSIGIEYIPEPSSLGVVAFGVGVLLLRRRNSSR